MRPKPLAASAALVFLASLGFLPAIAQSIEDQKKIDQSMQGKPGNYTENLLLGFKDTGRGFHLDKSYDQPNNIMMEFVPDGETGQQWTEMITTITLKNLPQANTSAWIAGVAQRVQSRCPKFSILLKEEGSQIDDLRQSAGLPAVYKTFSLLLYCEGGAPSPNPNVHVMKHEVIWFKGIQGFMTAYLVQRAWHADELPLDSVVTSETARLAWKKWFDTVKISGLPDDKLRSAPTISQ